MRENTHVLGILTLVLLRFFSFFIHSQQDAISSFKRRKMLIYINIPQIRLFDYLSTYHRISSANLFNLQSHTQAKIIKKSVILFRLINKPK